MITHNLYCCFKKCGAELTRDRSQRSIRLKKKEDRHIWLSKHVAVQYYHPRQFLRQLLISLCFLPYSAFSLEFYFVAGQSNLSHLIVHHRVFTMTLDSTKSVSRKVRCRQSKHLKRARDRGSQVFAASGAHRVYECRVVPRL